ncbi:MAG: PKD domain-containing protein, partial [Candidatus Thorarchaeota archaeon]
IDLSWSKGSNADYTYIEWRATSGTWNRGDETELYNNTGTSTSQSGLNPGTTRYYQAWSYNTTDGTWSSSYATGHDTTDSNTAPAFGSESPTNGTGSQDLSFSWSIPISDANGDTFNWTIECNNSQSSNANGASNGTKSLSVSGLNYSTTYTIWVNATDSYDSISKWFTFTTKDAPSNDHPTFGTSNPTNGSTDVSQSLSSWTIPINDPEGDNISWSIETSPDVGNASQNGEGNGTKSCSLSGLQYSTTYTIFVNATDVGSDEWTNQTFWFETEGSPNQNPNPPVDPDPENNEPDVPVNVGTFSCLVTDPDGDSLDCSAYWSNHTLIDTNNSVANNTIVSFDVGTLEKDTTYYWYVNVSDGEFTVQSAIWNFTTVDNYAPVADFTLESNNATQTIWVNDTSTDSDGNVVYWAWDFDDGSADVHTENAIHMYSTGGSYIVELTIIDNDGGSDTKTIGVTLNYPPVASFLYIASDMNITVNGTSTDTEGAIVNWTWDWGDGNYTYTQNATHEYAIAGTYLVNLTVQDSHGSTTSTWNAITVPPTATAGFIENVDWLVLGAIIAAVLCGVFFVGMVWKR